MNIIEETKLMFQDIKIHKIFVVFFLLIVFYSIFVRAQGLGYSAFQGDEINPMTFLYEYKSPDFNFGKYLMSQKRGPGQYVIDYFNVKLFGYHNEWQIRFPFLIFGVLAFYTFYVLSKKFFDETTAFFTMLLLAINGLFLAFSRITQYQSFIYFIIPIGIYFFITAVEENSRKKFLFSGLLMTISLLAHYDTLSTLPFFIMVFFADLHRKMDGFSLKKEKNKKLVREMLINASLFFSFMLIPAFSYYIPYHLTKSANDATNTYLEARLFGGGLMPRTVITTKLVSMYIPVVHLIFLFVFEIVGLLYIGRNLTSIHVLRYTVNKKIVSVIYMFFSLLIFASTIFSFYPIKPRTSSVLVIGSSLVLSAILLISKKVKSEYVGLVTWALGSFSFYFFVMRDPRTHVYISLIPGFILIAYGITQLLYTLRNTVLKYVYLTLLLVMFVFVSIVNWVIYVDKTPEYPWQDKYVFGWNIYHIHKVRHKKIEGVFGFNQYRGWDKVGEMYKRGCLVGTFDSNEKDSITYFYVGKHQFPVNNEMLIQSDNLIPIDGPHSWYYSNIRDTYPGYVKLYELDNAGYPVMRIFGKKILYPEGKLLCDDLTFLEK